MEKKTKVKDGQYIVIQAFMLKDLKLKNNELLTYAIIYGFSQDGETAFTGSLQYLADWTNSTKQSVLKNIKSLIEKGLIEKKDVYRNNIKFCEYTAVLEFNTIKQSLPGIKQSLTGGIKQSLIGGIKQSLPNNIDLDNIELDNIENIKDIKDAAVKKTKKSIFADYAADNTDLLNALNDFEAMRKAIKKPMTDKAKQLLINRLQKLSDDAVTQILILNQSTFNSWQNIYDVKENTNNGGYNKNFNGKNEQIRYKNGYSEI